MTCLPHVIGYLLMNQPDKKKQKFTYFEFREVLDELKQIAASESKNLAKNVTLPEVIRELTLNRANQHRKLNGKAPLEGLDPAAGKFAPGAARPARAVITKKLRLEVFDKNGKLMPEYGGEVHKGLRRLRQHFPRCPVVPE